ncbi:MAG: hypothetical protein IPO56_06130 [Flavobacteriales bacterium]|nr:hypothetical protein [Flavobacteriales bacterium]
MRSTTKALNSAATTILIDKDVEVPKTKARFRSVKTRAGLQAGALFQSLVG